MNNTTQFAPLILDAQHTAVANAAWRDWYDDDLTGVLPVTEWQLLTGDDAISFINYVQEIHTFMRKHKITDAAAGYAAYIAQVDFGFRIIN